MSNTTVEPIPDTTKAPEKTTTKATPSTTTNLTTTVTTTTTTNITLTTSIDETTSDHPVTTTNNTQAQDSNGDGSNVAPIVGGCFGAVAIIAIIVIIVVIYITRRRKRRKSLKKAPVPPPGKDFLDTVHKQHAINYHRENNAVEDKQYVNLTPGGERDDQTDPSVGYDGYLKKKKLKHKRPKTPHSNGKVKTNVSGGRSNEERSTELPIYTNEVSEHYKEPVARTNSVPLNEAPPPPRKSSEYATGRIAGHSENQSNEQNVDSTLNKDYVNLSEQQIGEAALGVSPSKINHSSGERKKKHNNNSRTETEVPDLQQKLYENVNGANYYNLRDNQQETVQRQSTYEDVGEESGTTLQQDDVYENP